MILRHFIVLMIIKIIRMTMMDTEQQLLQFANLETFNTMMILFQKFFSSMLRYTMVGIPTH